MARQPAGRSGVLSLGTSALCSELPNHTLMTSLRGVLDLCLYADPHQAASDAPVLAHMFLRDMCARGAL